MDRSLQTILAVAVAGTLVTLATMSIRADVPAGDAAAQQALVSDTYPTAALSPAEFLRATELPDVTIIDVRTPGEFNGGHLAGAVNIDYNAPDFELKLAELDKSKPYAVYCRSGNRSGRAVYEMQSLGFTNVSDLDGGIIAWTAAGFPLCSGPDC